MKKWKERGRDDDDDEPIKINDDDDDERNSTLVSIPKFPFTIFIKQFPLRLQC